MKNVLLFPAILVTGYDSRSVRVLLKQQQPVSCQLAVQYQYPTQTRGVCPIYCNVYSVLWRISFIPIMFYHAGCLPQNAAWIRYLLQSPTARSHLTGMSDCEMVLCMAGRVCGVQWCIAPGETLLAITRCNAVPRGSLLPDGSISPNPELSSRSPGQEIVGSRPLSGPEPQSRENLSPQPDWDEQNCKSGRILL